MSEGEWLRLDVKVLYGPTECGVCKRIRCKERPYGKLMGDRIDGRGRRL